jgi:hypothetical protein
MITINSSCVGKQFYGIRYLWRMIPCLFKQAAICRDRQYIFLFFIFLRMKARMTNKVKSIYE